MHRILDNLESTASLSILVFLRLHLLELPVNLASEHLFFTKCFLSASCSSNNSVQADMGKHTQNPRVLQTAPTSEAASSITIVQIAAAEKRICWLLLLGRPGVSVMSHQALLRSFFYIYTFINYLNRYQRPPRCRDLCCTPSLEGWASTLFSYTF